MKVCRRWRYLILGSASHLGLCLVCSTGTPVAEMLAHSPPFPLIIDHDHTSHDLTPEDERGIIFALEHRDRVRRIYLSMPVPSLQKVVKAMVNQFSILEYLLIAPPTSPDTHLVLPATFSAPQLSHLKLNRLSSPIGSRLLTAAVSLVTLRLRWMHPSTNSYPNHLLQALSLLHQLKHLSISFSSPVPNREIERHMLHTPNITHTMLPNLVYFKFGGVSTYLDALLSHMNAPLLEELKVHFFNQLSYITPNLRQLVMTTENLRCSSVKCLFYHKAVKVFDNATSWRPIFNIYVGCDHLDWQVSSIAQIFNVLSPLVSAVVDLTLDYRSHTLSSEWHNQADRAQWRKLLRSFRNVETLRVHDGLVGELSRCLTLHQETFWLLNRLSEPWNTSLGSLKARLGSLRTLRLAKTLRGFLMWMENRLQRSYLSSKHWYAPLEVMMRRLLQDLSVTVSSRACLSTSSKTSLQLAVLSTASELRLARRMSGRTLLLCQPCEAPDVEDCYARA